MKYNEKKVKAVVGQVYRGVKELLAFSILVSAAVCGPLVYQFLEGAVVSQRIALGMFGVNIP